MTDSPKPVISDAEVEAFAASLCVRPEGPPDFVARYETGVAKALSAFLSARVPPERDILDPEYFTDEVSGFNACRDIILKGRGG